VDYALSIKQPWAALVVHGFKTIEIRRWATPRRGRILIHAARTPDPRPEAWAHVPDTLENATRLEGGILGQAQLVDCRTYKSSQAFARDRLLHLNEPGWFQGPAMHGFVFADARPLTFRRWPGSLYFFEVPTVLDTVEPTSTGLLVSVRSVAEAAAALEGGADVIDVKEPRHGALGRAPAEVTADILRLIAGRCPVSAALGELAELREPGVVPGLSFVKCGLAHLGRGTGWQRRLRDLRARVAQQPQPPAVVTVAYADWERARAPSWLDVAEYALRQPGSVLLIDTFDKTLRLPSRTGPSPRRRDRAGGRAGSPATLLDWLSLEQVRQLCRRCHGAGVRVAVAGSLRLPHLLHLLDARPTWFAVRGAVCEANDRDGAVHVLKVRSLAELLRWKQAPAIDES
jgi:uncharacterized protein (UPF0264 family)